MPAVAAAVAIAACAFGPTTQRPSGAATDEASFRSVHERVLDGLAPSVAPQRAATHRMSLSLVLLRDGGWPADVVQDAVREALKILGQCAIQADHITVHEFDAPASYRVLWTPVSREFARRAAVRKPAVFFVADTKNDPAFDAEAVGRANARMRPEMADTLWIVAGARDLPIVVAHELMHVLSDSGRHSEEPANLMREETAPQNVRLTDAQCAAAVRTATQNGLLRSEPSTR